MNIVDKLRLNLVDRFQTVSISRRQSVAEHTYNVAIIAIEIASKIPTVPTATVAIAALQHDLEEVMFGDITMPAKRRLAEAGLNYSKAKRKFLGPDIPVYEDNIMAVVKAADWLDALTYFDEYGHGRHKSHRIDIMKSQYDDWLEKQHPTLVKAVIAVAADLMTEWETVL